MSLASQRTRTVLMPSLRLILKAVDRLVFTRRPMVDTSNVEYLPVWKAEATAEERLLELAMIARKHPERFAKMAVVYVEVKPNGRWEIRSIDAGMSTIFEEIGILRAAMSDAESRTKA